MYLVLRMFVLGKDKHRVRKSLFAVCFIREIMIGEKREKSERK